MLTLPQCSHITRKRGVYYWRRRLPGTPRGEVALSLRTRRYREAEHLASRLDMAFGAAWRRAKASVSASAGKTDLNAILREYLREKLDADSIRASWPLGMLEEGLEQTRDHLAGREDWSVRTAVDTMMQRHELPEDERYRLTIGTLEADLLIFRELIRRAKGEVPTVFTDPGSEEIGPVPERYPPASPPLAQPVPPTPPVPKASELVGLFLEVRGSRDNATHKQRGEEHATIRRFMEVAGDKNPADYGRGDVTRYLNTLRQLPSSYGKSPKDAGRTLADIIADPARAGQARVTERTAEKHLNALRQFFQYAVDVGQMRVATRVELVDGHRFGAATEGAREQRDVFTPEELRRLFASPVWAGRHPFFRDKRGEHVIRDAHFWLPLLALFHGARLEEMADLKRGDVRRDGGLWSLHIRPAPGRRLKNKNASRVIPLHPEMVKLGFPQHIMAVTNDDADPIFADLTPRGKDMRRGVDVTKWFTRYRRAIGLARDGLTFHSFRHTAITRISDAITDLQQKRHRNRIMGHASEEGGEGDARYDKGPDLHAAAQTLALLQFPELDLRKLYVVGATEG
ncbi:site-specific integrase [Sabulicella rubraurantiaca]|uniref:site-specific integrase n=1 Tax=Sabulicella rubraurantiaca TaxID=2811429 RepID=UPI002E284A40|nr:site-specific integrase [Sabulicella rubraurantiaca]